MGFIVGRNETERPYIAQLVCLSAMWLLFSGCASRTYRFGDPRKPFSASSSSVDPAAFHVTVGGEHPKLDRMERIVQYPAKKLKQWFKKSDEAEPSEEQLRDEALQQTVHYLALNGLSDVHIDVREYNPREQWQRLRANDDIAPFWKYTAGSLRHVEYCLMPGRVFGQDSYNVFTNTLHINSTHPEQSLYTAATAKYMRSKTYPGAFATACYLPIVPLYRDVHVANDVLSYARFREDWETEQELYPQIYSSFGGDLVSQATSLVPAFAYLPFYVKPALQVVGSVSGNVTGKAVLKMREDEIKAQQVSTQSVSTSVESASR